MKHFTHVGKNVWLDILNVSKKKKDILNVAGV